jgi:hypothetical protein
MSYQQQQPGYYGPPPSGQYGQYPPPQQQVSLRNEVLGSWKVARSVADQFVCVDVLRPRPATTTGRTQEGQGLSGWMVSHLFKTQIKPNQLTHHAQLVWRLCAAVGCAEKPANAVLTASTAAARPNGRKLQHHTHSFDKRRSDVFNLFP